MESDWWVTPSGTTVQVGLSGPRDVRNHDSVAFDLTVSSTGGSSAKLEVRFDAPRLADVARQHQGRPAFTDDERRELALIAGLRAVDEEADFFEDVARDPLFIGPGDEDSLRSHPPVSDQALRRYIARRLYLEWKQGGFDRLLQFSPVDAALTGASEADFLRNLQLLEQEGFVKLHRSEGRGFWSFPGTATAPLIRAVERHGATPGDIETSTAFLDRIRHVRALEGDFAAIELQRARYEVAQTPEEVVSVFRSIAPVVEKVAQKLLTARGSAKKHSSLGPMIADLQGREIGGLPLLSQLNALKTNARDVSLHGGDLPPTVLRIAVELSFELLPQLGQLLSTNE